MRAVSLWWRAVRPFSFTVSVLPPVLGALLAVMENAGLGLHWPHFFLTVVGCVVAHSASNLLSDYFDYTNRVDRDETFGSSRVLVEGAMTPRAILLGGLTCLLVAAGIGLYFVLAIPNGRFLIWLIILGGFLAVFYTAKPFELKYNALGDVAVFIAFGSAMTLGAYFVQASRFSWGPVLYALPLALLVDAVLHGNNLRDIEHDKHVDIKTVPILIGKGRAVGMYCGLVFGAYLLTVVLVLAAGLPAVALVTWLSLPLAVKLVRLVRRHDSAPAEQFAAIDARTAQLHTAFGVLLIGSLLVYQLLFSAAQ